MPSDSSPATFWDARFAGDAYAYGTEPNEFLRRQRHRLERGMAVLCVADGEGRNGVWLAGQGMRVTSVDASPVGLQKALKLALKREVMLHAVCADLRDWDWPVAAYDAVVAVFIHFRPDVRAEMHARMLAACKPGGLVIMEMFRPEQVGYGSGGPPDRDMLYSATTLRNDFATAEILELEEATPELDEGPFHQGPAATVRLVARRPC